MTVGKQHLPFWNNTGIHHKRILEIIKDGLHKPFLQEANKKVSVAQGVHPIKP